MSLHDIVARTSGSLLRTNPKVLSQVVNQMLLEASPKKVARTLREQFDLSRKFVAKRTGIELRAAKPSLKLRSPLKKGVKPGLKVKPKVVKEVPLPPLPELQKKYADFSKHWLMYEQGLKAQYYIGHVFNAKEFEGTGVSLDNRFNDYVIYAGEDRRKNIGDVSRGGFGRYMDIKPDHVETLIDLDTVNINIGFSNSEFANEQRMAAVRIIQTYFPNFKLPTEWRMEEKDGVQSVNLSVGLSDMGIEYTLEKFASLKPKYTHANNQDDPRYAWKGPNYFELPRDYPRRFANIASLRLTLNGTEARLAQGSRARMSGMQSGSIASLGTYGNRITIPVSVQLVLRWPMEFAAYVTSCRTKKDFIPFLFYQYISTHRVAYGSAKSTKKNYKFTVKAPARVNHLGVVKETIAEERKAGRNPQPRVNDDDFAIIGLSEASMVGDVVWIPRDVDRVEDYVQQIKNAYNAETKEIEFRDFQLKGKPLFTDWHSEKFSFVRESGLGSSTDAADASGVLTYDLLGAKPLDSTTIDRDLRKFIRNMPDVHRSLGGYIDKFVSGELGPQPDAEYFTLDYLARDEQWARYVRPLVSDKMTGLLNNLAASRLGIQWGSLGGMPIDADPDMPQAQEQAYCRLAEIVFKDFANKFDDLQMGIQAKLNLRYWVWLVTKYAANHKTFRQESASKETRNRAGTEELNDEQRATKYGDISKVTLPNLPGLKLMMPHQIETLSVLNDPPEACLTDVHMGGGKTLIGLAEAAKLIHEKKVKRAIVICPPQLVRSWVNEINEYTQGEINPFAITLTAQRRLSQAISGEKHVGKGIDYKVMRKVIESCPSNTLFVTSYNFLRSHVEKVLYANQDVSRYVAAEHLRDIGFDMVILDESHKAKNLATAQTMATAILTSAAKYTRIMSGTMVNNVLTDLVGQAAMVNPAAYGKTKDFMAKYGAGQVGSMTVWNDQSEQRMINDARPYMQRVVHKRQRWAFVLPTLIANFYMVEMTEKQQEFYSAQLETIVADYLAKPEIQEKLRSASKEEQSKIIEGLTQDPIFSKFEEFVYAPDKNEGFAALDGVTEEDLVSPKIAQIVKLLDLHFEGGHDPRSGETVEPNQYKVIIFGYRKVTSEHVYKHLPAKYKKMTAYYTAQPEESGGDPQALDSFLKNDKIKILLANEASINTGQNLQIASRMIRIETLWTPGDQDQALARIWRPDFKNLEGRPKVYSDWIFTNGSLEVGKIGRLITKIVSKMKYDWAESPQFSRKRFDLPEGPLKARLRSIIPAVDHGIPVADQIPDPPPILMNLDGLRAFRSVDTIQTHLGAFALISHWENMEFERQKAQAWAKVSPVPDSSRATIEGSKKLAWVPRLEGVDPDKIDPEGKFGYKPISIVESALALEAAEAESADDDDEGDDDSDLEAGARIVEVNACSEGDLVDTEFGFGFITKVLKNTVRVNVPGLKHEVVCPKAATWLVTDEQAKAAIRRQIKANGKRGLARLPGEIADMEIDFDTPFKKVKEPRSPSSPVGGGGGGKKVQIKKPQTQRKYGEEDEDVTDDDDKISVFGEIIDGQIALTCMAEDNDSEQLIDDYGFKSIPSYHAVRIKTSAALIALLAKMKKKFIVKQSQIDNFEPYIGMMKSKQLGKHDPAQFADTMRFFNITTHKHAGDNEIRPFPIVWGGKLFLAFDKAKTKKATVTKFINMCQTSGIPGLQVKPVQDGVHIRLFKSKQAAIALMQEIKSLVDKDSYKETMEFLRGLTSTSKPKDEDKPKTPRNQPAKAPPKTQVKVTKPPAKKPAAKVPAKKVVAPPSKPAKGAKPTSKPFKNQKPVVKPAAKKAAPPPVKKKTPPPPPKKKPAIKLPARRR